MWPELIDLARWAPSPHNIQPWRLRPRSETEAELLYAPDRLLPDTDPAGRFSAVGLGVFIETLAVAAHARSLDVDTELVSDRLEPTDSEPRTWARLRLVPYDGPRDLDPQVILDRRTSRLPYDGRPVAEDVLAEISAVAASFGHQLETSSDQTFVDWVLGLNRETLFEDLLEPKARREVGSWLRFSEREAATHRDGFSPSALGFPGRLLHAYFRLAPVFELPGLRHAIRALYFRTMRGTRTIAWFTGPFDRQEDWLAAGRMLGRAWLVLTARGVYLHPFGSIITNARANAALQARIAASAPGRMTWLIARLGYSAVPPRSHRLETRELLVD